MRKDRPIPQPLPVLNPMIEKIQQDVRWWVVAQRNHDFLRKLGVNTDDETEIERGGQLWRSLVGHNVDRPAITVGLIQISSDWNGRRAR